MFTTPTLFTLLWLAGIHAPAQPLTDNQAFRHIPPDADAVYHVDLGSVFSKANTRWVEAPLLSSIGAGSFASVLRQGIDLHRDLYLAISHRYQPDSPKFATVIVSLSDAGKLIAWLHSQIRALRPFDQNTQVLTSSDMAIAWDQHRAVMVFRTSSPTSPMYSIDLIRETNYRRALAAWRGFPNSYFSTGEEFRKAFLEKADAHFWNRHGTGYDVLNKALQMIPGGAHLAGMTRNLKATPEHTVGILRFDTGRISYCHRRLATPDEKASMIRLINPPLAPELVAGAPFGKVMAVATLHYDPSAFADTMGRLTRQRITTDDVSGALKGDCLLLAYAPDDGQPNSGSKQMPDIFGLFTVRDSAAFARLASAYKLTNAVGAPDVDTIFHTPFHYFALHNGIAVITTTPQMADNYFNFSASASNPTGRLLSQNMKDGSLSIGIDMHLWGNWLLAVTKGTEDAAEKNARKLAQVYAKMGIFTFSTGHVIGNDLETDFDLTLADPGRNSLAVCLDLLRELTSGGNMPH